MTTPPTPQTLALTPEQVEEVAKRMLEQSFTSLTWAMIHHESKEDLRRYAKWHLSELSTLREQVVGLRAQIVVKDEALRRLTIGTCSCGVKTNATEYHAHNCEFRIASEALTPAAKDSTK
jgi:hypothetical protein